MSFYPGYPYGGPSYGVPAYGYPSTVAPVAPLTTSYAV